MHTMDALWRLYSAGALKDRRPQTQDAYAGVWRRLEPRIGNADVASITTEQLQALHGAITTRAGKYAANRTLALVIVLLALAVKAKWRPDNPARGVERHREHGRERYLSPEEIERLLAVVDQQDDLAAKAIEFLLLTGCRKGEALSASGIDFDLRAGVWTKPAQLDQEPARCTGFRCRRRRRGCSPACRPGRPSAARSPSCRSWQLHRRWVAIRREAGLEDVRIHDLRHSLRLDPGQLRAVAADHRRSCSGTARRRPRSATRTCRTRR